MARYIPYKDIDKEKWDRCINNATNGLIYAHSFYLDFMAESWDALILGDYNMVMPLTWRKKMNIRYLYQPAFIQQGGIFSADPVDSRIISMFLQESAIHFKFAEITLNYQNAPHLPEGIKSSLRTNYIIDLKMEYQLNFNNYEPAFTKSLRRIKKFNLQYIISQDHLHAIDLYQELYGKRLPYFTTNDYNNFKQLCDHLSAQQKIIVRHAVSNENELLAAVVLIKHNNRLYNIISCITAEGKKKEANYFLYDKITEEFSNKGLVLDLEGSDVKGIANFYKKMNPANEPYPFIKYNNLPRLLRLFKK